MSEAYMPELNITRPPVGYSRRRHFRSLRLLIVPDLTPGLLVSLVVIPSVGHPFIHPEVKALWVPADPKESVGDVSLWSLTKALQGVTQTRS
jgi:hypothetical protein